MRRWFSRAKSALAGLAAAAIVATAAPAHAEWEPHPDDSLLFDIRLGQYRLGDGVRGYQTPGSICIDLGDVIAGLDVPIDIDAEANRAQGWAFLEENQIVIDRAAGRLTFGESRQALPQDVIFDTPEGWCVASQALAEWLGIAIEADLRNAVLLVSAEEALPVERALERRDRAARIRPRIDFDLSTLPQAQTPYRMWRTPSLDAVVRLGGLRDRQRGGEQFTRRYELFAAGEALTMSVDARLASDDRGAPNSLRMRAFRSSARPDLLGPLGATHFAIGDVSSQPTPIAAQPTSGRGFVVTNRPIERPHEFDRKTFRGNLPEGWDAELYRNGQLLGFATDRGDGRYEFVDIDLRYGINRFEIVLYGPQGQIRRETEVVNVGEQSIPPRKTWYWVGASEDNRDLVTLGDRYIGRSANWRTGFGIERGINARASLAFQLNNLVIADERVTVAEGSLRRSFGPALVEVTGAWADNGGLAARARLLSRFGRTYISAESLIADNFNTERHGVGLTGRHAVSVDHNFRLGRTIVPFNARATYETRVGGRDEIDISARLSANLRRFSLTGEATYRRQGVRIGPDPPSETLVGMLANGRIGRVRLRGEAQWRLAPENRFESAALTAEWANGENSSWRAMLGYQSAYDRVRAAVGYVRHFDNFALTCQRRGRNRRIGCGGA